MVFKLDLLILFLLLSNSFPPNVEYVANWINLIIWILALLPPHFNSKLSIMGLPYLYIKCTNEPSFCSICSDIVTLFSVFFFMALTCFSLTTFITSCSDLFFNRTLPRTSPVSVSIAWTRLNLYSFILLFTPYHLLFSR